MKEFVELRFFERHAARFFRPEEGDVLAHPVGPPLIRRVRLSISDPRLPAIGSAALEARKRGEILFGGWKIDREYTSGELQAAELLHLTIQPVFEPAGEQCGTEYDETTACSICGAGRRRSTPLRLDPHRLPRTRHAARSIATDEWIISSELAALLRTEGMTGLDLDPVHRRITSRRRTPLPWYAMSFATAATELAKRTRLERGPVGPFGDPNASEYACANGDTVGLNLISEIYIHRDSWPRTDLAVTRQFVGHRMGLLRPRRLLLASPRLLALLKRHRIRGFGVEVAHLT